MFVSSLFPPTAVIWKSCITVLSLKTVLRSPSPYKEMTYWELPQNSIFWIGFKFCFLFLSPGVAWPFCISLTLKTCCQEPVTFIPSWTAHDNRHTNALPVHFSPHQKQWDLRGITLRAGQALTTICSSRGTQPSLFQTQSSTRMHTKIYIFHITTLSPFGSTLISETEMQVNQAFWETNLFFHLSTLTIWFLICLAISW